MLAPLVPIVPSVLSAFVLLVPAHVDSEVELLRDVVDRLRGYLTPPQTLSDLGDHIEEDPGLLGGVVVDQESLEDIIGEPVAQHVFEDLNVLQQLE